MEPRRHQARDMGHIHPQVSPHLIGDGAEAFKINHSGIGGCPRDDHAGLALVGDALHLVIVDHAGLLVYAVGHHFEILPGEIHRAAMGEVPAVIQIHAQHRVAGLAQGHIDGVVGLGAGMGLDVGKLRAKQLARALNGQVLRHVHTLAAAVIPLAGVALSVLVGEHAAHGGQHRLGRNVLRRNELNIVALPLILRPDGRAHLGVVLGHKVHILQNHICLRLSNLVPDIIHGFSKKHNCCQSKKRPRFFVFFVLSCWRGEFYDKTRRAGHRGGAEGAVPRFPVLPAIREGLRAAVRRAAVRPVHRRTCEQGNPRPVRAFPHPGELCRGRHRRGGPIHPLLRLFPG